MRLGNGGAGRADIFISWALVSTMFDLLEAIELYVKEHGLDPWRVKFWICNFSIRQNPGPGKNADVARLGKVGMARLIVCAACSEGKLGSVSLGHARGVGWRARVHGRARRVAHRWGIVAVALCDGAVL